MEKVKKKKVVKVKKKNLKIGIGIAIAAALILLIVLNMDFTNHDAFAQCLNDAGVVMYGSKWCPHCKDMKGKFGSSMEYMQYVECSDSGEPERCRADGIKMYPAFKFKDGTVLYGEMDLEILGNKAGCTVEQDDQ
ncbi:hypothetical protein KY362_01590 [Candidatus Woesearchaeota archaeon]|nr:hypothetical protein [Candidatus Woesearchaeota archaeon]